jgi:NAD(P)-dependent dehydrogenase (short-subunit alcohol dehydrogenase family)
MDLQLTDHVVVVTGASRGIGLAIADTLLDEGARVVAASRTRGPELDGLAAAHVDRLLHVVADLTRPEAAAEVVARALEVFGGLDALVNNAGGEPAGRTPPESFLDLTDHEWQATLDLNLLSAVRASRAALPVLLERGGGVIVNVSSVNGRRPFPFVVDYAAAKAAMTNLSKALSEEFAPRGVRVNTVSPGPVRTPWWTRDGGIADRMAGRLGTDREAVVAQVVPEAFGLATGRFAEPEEVAHAVALLLSPRAANTTGAEVVIDSGFLKTV